VTTLRPSQYRQLADDLRIIGQWWHALPLNTERWHSDDGNGARRNPNPPAPCDLDTVDDSKTLLLVPSILRAWDWWASTADPDHPYVVPRQLRHAGQRPGDSGDDVLDTVQARCAILLANFDIACTSRNIERIAQDIGIAAAIFRKYARDQRRLEGIGEQPDRATPFRRR
jgi:hypothetical protein